jgi:hypothetical protein
VLGFNSDCPFSIPQPLLRAHPVMPRWIEEFS